MRSTLTKTRGIMLVAVLALVLGAFGSAGSSYAAGLTGKQVKKIAAKVINKKAPSLSVAHAQTAGSATSATNATNATNAQSAANAALLNGLTSGTYLDRQTHENITASTNIPAADVTQIMNPNVINVPAGVGFIHVTGVASFATGNTNVLVWPSFDSGCTQAGIGYEHRGQGNTTTQTSVPFDMVVPVSAGNHSVRVCTISGAATIAGIRSMTIRTVAGDFNG